MDKNLQDALLRNKVETTFLKKDVSVNEPHILAAMITAASEMSICSDGIATPEMTTEQLLDLYQKKDDENVSNLIGMSSGFVKNNIGYSVQFEDMIAAEVNYHAEKPTYDEIYRGIAARANAKENEAGKTI
jgi:hypothetical protein